jgi:Cys-tRNA(Pro)/Cys-tRNA(Cys) deacylase
MKTNAARIKEQHGFEYEIVEYEMETEEYSAEDVAVAVGMPPEQVFKTLVVRGDHTGAMLAVIPGSSNLGLKKLAVLSGDKSVEMVALKDVQPLTGYVRGGVSPLGTRRKLPVFFDEMCLVWDTISVSAGLRGAQIVAAPADLVKAASAVTGDITA